MSTDSWQRTDRRTIYQTPHMSVYEDNVLLPSGATIDDYSVVDLPDGVLVVATDERDRLILFEEYKYAVNDTVLTFPAGGIDAGETPEKAALRELLEETGYEATDASLLSSTYPYPSKLAHINHIVRVTGAINSRSRQLEEAEAIGEVLLVSKQDIAELIKSGRIKASYMIAGLALAFPEYLT